MGDMGDVFNGMKDEMRKASQEKRGRNRETSLDVLLEKGIDFVVKNYGAHLIVKGKNGLIDFWHGTGKFIARNGGKGRGVFNLIKLCK